MVILVDAQNMATIRTLSPRSEEDIRASRLRPVRRLFLVRRLDVLARWRCGRCLLVVTLHGRWLVVHVHTEVVLELHLRLVARQR